MWIMSDRTIPRSFRFMEGFGVHTFRFVNAGGKSTFVKFHWKPKLGLQSVVWNEAVKINGADPDFHRRDLWNAIQMGDYPEWELGLQLFDEDFADKFDFDVLDATKIIPEEDVPVRRVGRLVLDRCVDNFFAETEQVAFCTQNIVPGIDFTNDPLLQGRNFSYLDTQLKRLGSPNFTHIPINAPKCPFAHFQQDGHMALVNPKGRANYEPNSWEGEGSGPRESPEKGFTSFPSEEQGAKLRIRSETFADHYSQARQFYLSQTDTEQNHIANALIFELSKVERVAIRARMVSHLLNVDSGLAKQVADGLGLKEMPNPADAAKPTREDLKKSPALSILLNAPGVLRDVR
jgi:catalase